MRYKTTDENRALTLVMAGDGSVFFLRRNLDEGIAGVVFVFSLVLLQGKP
jgi:hypothetical protein